MKTRKTRGTRKIKGDNEDEEDKEEEEHDLEINNKKNQITESKHKNQMITTIKNN